MLSYLKCVARRALRSAPRLFGPIWRHAYPIFQRDERWAGTEYSGGRKETFTTIYRENRWGNEESVSGSGSTLGNTKLVRTALEKALRRTGASSLLDAPCGDFNWMKEIRLPDTINYLGGEIVPELVDNLQREHGSFNKRFLQLDIVSDPLPTADLWLCRHVLMHLSNEEVQMVLANFARSDISYVLFDNYDFVRSNRDIQTGGYRYVNLQRPPFNLPRALASYQNSIPPEAPDYLMLWSRAQIASVHGATMAANGGRSVAPAADMTTTRTAG